MEGKMAALFHEGRVLLTEFGLKPCHFRRQFGKSPQVFTWLIKLKNLFVLVQNAVLEIFQRFNNSLRIEIRARDVFYKHGDKIIPKIVTLTPYIRFQKTRRKPGAARPIGQRASGVRIESPAVDGELVKRPVGRSVDIQKTMRLEHAERFKIRDPEKLRVLEG